MEEVKLGIKNNCRCRKTIGELTGQNKTCLSLYFLSSTSQLVSSYEVTSAYGDSLPLASGLHNIRPARASYSIVENAAKARSRISNCRSRNSSMLPRNLYIEMKWTFAARGKFMLIIWPFEVSVQT